MSKLVIQFENMAMVALEEKRSRVFLPKAGHTAKLRTGDAVHEFTGYTRVEILVNGQPLTGRIRTKNLLVYQTSQARRLTLKDQNKLEALSLAEIELGGDGVLEALDIKSSEAGANDLTFTVGDDRKTSKDERLTNRMKFELDLNDGDKVVLMVDSKEFVLKENIDTRNAVATFTVGEKQQGAGNWGGELSDARMAFDYVDGGDGLELPRADLGGGGIILGDPICVAIVIAFFVALWAD